MTTQMNNSLPVTHFVLKLVKLEGNRDYKTTLHSFYSSETDAIKSLPKSNWELIDWDYRGKTVKISKNTEYVVVGLEFFNRFTDIYPGHEAFDKFIIASSFHREPAG